MTDKTPEFGSTISPYLGGHEQQSNMGLFQGNFKTALPPDVALDQMFSVFNGYQESRNYNTVVSGDNSTGIRVRPRQVRNELQNMNHIFQGQGTAPRRIHLQLHEDPVISNKMEKSESCASEAHDTKSFIEGVRCC